MKKTVLLSLLVLLIGSFSFAQTTTETISATYSAGDIGTSHLFRYDGDSSPCPGQLNVAVPDGAIVLYVDVTYDMTSVSPQRRNQQRSQLWCTSTGGTKEPQVYNGSGYSAGTYSYSRTGLDIAFGLQPQNGEGLDFELHAGTSYYSAPDECSIDYTKVDDGTWTITVEYLPAGSPGFPGNPSPADEAMLVSLNPTLTWDFGTNTETYDLYFGTDNPPTTIVVPDGSTNGQSSGSYTPATLDYGTEYFWKVVCKNTTNDNPGTVWSFNTRCDTPAYPYDENFDGVTAPDLPNCWVPTISSSSEYSKVVTKSSSKSRSYPNYVVFAADVDPNPDLILVLPEVDNISDMMLSLYGMNDVDWNTNQPYQYPFEIGTMSDPFDASTFTAFDTYIPGGEWTLKEVYFYNYTGTDTYIAIKGIVPQYGQMYLDDVTLDLIPDCMKPLDLTLDTITATTATISWTDILGSPGEWQLEYDTTGFQLGTGTQVIVNSNPATITDLLDGAYYDVYARAICSVGDTSAWSWPITILTDCLPKDIPIYEDFGARPPYPLEPELPVCWYTVEESASNNATIKLTYSASYTGYSGEGIEYNARNDETSQLILVSPEIEPVISTLQTSFWAKKATTGAGTADGIIVGTMSDPLDYTTFTPFDTIREMTTDWMYYTVYFVNYTGTDAYIAWRHNSEEYSDIKIYLDDIAIEELPSCIVPVNADVLSVSQETADIYWEDLNGATAWTIKVGDPGFDPDNDPSLSYPHFNSNPNGSETFTIPDLTSTTSYDCYIRTSCGGGDVSDWTGPLSFTTSYDQIQLPFYEDFESGMGMTANDDNNNVDWVINTNYYVSGSQCIYNDYTGNNDNVLYVTGSFDLTNRDNMMLSFNHIAKTDGGYDHCYVEISTDGGYSYEFLPLSTYMGQNGYRFSGYNPIGPSFDEDSYSDWGTGYQTPTNNWWKKEYFDLSDYNMYDNVSIRFRISTNGYGNKYGWLIDDIEIGESTPPEFSVDPLSITETLNDNETANINMNLGNAGGFPTNFTATVVYDEDILFDEGFDNGIPATWSVVNNGTSDTTWRMNTAYQTFYTFDGTPFAFCNGQKPAGEYEPRVDADLMSPVLDASAYLNKGLRLEFDQAFSAYWQAGDTARVYVYDGTKWVMIYEAHATDGKLGYNSNGVHKAYDVSAYANENFQVRFNYVVASGSKGYYFAVDNVRLRASDQALGWLTVDGAEYIDGVVLPDTDNSPTVLDVMLNPHGIRSGTYTADIELTSDDPNNAQVTVPVTLTVIQVPYTISFWCEDQNGNPLEGVDVTIDDETVTSDASGLSLFTDYVYGNYDYTAVKSGYGTVEGAVLVDGADVDETVVMLTAYDISFWCVDEDNNPLSDVDVVIGNDTVTSDASGLALFTDYIPGDYNYTAVNPNYVTATGTVTVVDADVDETVVMLSGFDISFWCVDEDANPMAGVEVTIGDETVTSDANGLALFTANLPGDYDYTADKYAYWPVTGTVTVTDADVDVDVVMVLQRFDISFWCQDVDDNPVSGVEITIDGVTVTSNYDGLALFEDYPVGDYDYEAQKEGYMPVSGSVSVVDQDVNVDVTMFMITYSISFWCTDENGDPLEGVDVTIDEETVTSDADGLALFQGVEPGYYYYTAMKPGYQNMSGTVNIIDENAEIDITMLYELYTVTFHVMDMENNPLEGAEVEFNDNTATTGADGIAAFDDVIIGSYDYMVTKEGYEPAEGVVDVVNGDVDVPVSMEILAGIVDNSLENVRIYPNPARHMVNIDNAANSSMRMISQYGKTVMIKDLEEAHATISVASFPAGIYYVILSNDKNTHSYKLLISK